MEQDLDEFICEQYVPRISFSHGNDPGNGSDSEMSDLKMQDTGEWGPTSNDIQGSYILYLMGPLGSSFAVWELLGITPKFSRK